MEKNVKKDYAKKYYENNKEKMLQQIKVSKSKSKTRNILRKLNDGKYTRIPHTVMERHNIIYDQNNKKYIIDENKKDEK